MLTKQCSKCREIKKVSEFPFKDTKRRIYGGYCKECRKIYIRSHYQANKEYYKTKAKDWDEKNHTENRKNVMEYFNTHPCVDCGESDPVVLEFDHVRGKKLHPVSIMMHRAWTWNKIQEEIEKCEVRCANCHKRKTSKQFNYWKESHQ